MSYRVGSMFLIGFLLPMTGCDALRSILVPSTVTITFENESAQFKVDGTIVYDDRNHLLKADLRAFGTERDFDLDPGELFSFPPFDCDDLETLMIEDADLRIAIGISPETSTDVLRMGEDFECGDEIVFTFSGDADFGVSLTTR